MRRIALPAAMLVGLLLPTRVAAGHGCTGYRGPMGPDLPPRSGAGGADRTAIRTALLAALIERFQDRREGHPLRRAYAIALGSVATPADAEAIAALLRALRDGDAATRRCAMGALATITQRDAVTRRSERGVSPAAVRERS
ncbi:MAG: hypothetical protein FJ293_11440 [Planctomycetes bacterium]|nr:hypothetical protein [Planctomycetota bacterium]